jgi:lipopolysaccharide transport system ATP-binding protein
MSAVISVEDLGKMYWLSHQQQPYLSLRDVISERVRGLFSRPRRETREEFWALRDVSFEVGHGDRIGLIGRNGAGKSTLLKVLSRITEPTVGRLRIRGRVASLLEVGTGFHPELTGRENIFLNGAVLGMTRTEIRQKFDEIVAFSEIEQFLDTPVKRYSSGMHVRLAFAVAAHLEPEILLVDEVLAVGDMRFQQKCLGKMEDVSTREGRTVVFVSHNLEAIRSLCTSGILLERGTVRHAGDIASVINTYIEDRAKAPYSLSAPTARGGAGGIVIRRVEVQDREGVPISSLTDRDPVVFTLEAEVAPDFRGRNNLHVGFGVDTADGRRLLTTVSSWENTSFTASGDQLKVRCVIPSLPLVPGMYLLSASVIHQMVETLDNVTHCAQFEVLGDSAGHHVARSPDHGFLAISGRFESYES